MVRFYLLSHVPLRVRVGGKGKGGRAGKHEPDKDNTKKLKVVCAVQSFSLIRNVKKTKNVHKKSVITFHDIDGDDDDYDDDDDDNDKNKTTMKRKSIIIMFITIIHLPFI